LCPENGLVDIDVDVDKRPRSSIRGVFTRAAYEPLIRGLPGFANGNAALVIGR